ncbi:MAG: metalloregulator ArsR/SmtB family transcription factor [Rhodobacteraceae bacterium]|nr:metalloregulator ArsR/SmtB family transcription factor [Paracoccaceae bacterium]
METTDALPAFAALSQPTRLAAFRLLVRAGDVGIIAGDLADKLEVRQNTLSANLSVLLNAGLVTNKREGREIRYFANMQTMRDLLAFLMEDCCGGRPELCQPLLDELSCTNRDMP